MLEEKFNKNNSDEYFAVRVLCQIDKDGNEKIMVDEDCTFIRMSGESSTFDELNTFNTNKKNIKEKFMFLPSTKNKVSKNILCVGGAGSGKSYLMNDYARLYRLMNPTNEILYFTLNNEKHDTSLDLSLYKVMPMQLFCDYLIESVNDNMDSIKEMGLMFQNKLLIFDDIGALESVKKEYKKAFWNFMNLSLENMRKFNVSSYIIMHTSRLEGYGKIVREELCGYIVCGSDLQRKSDRIMSGYFGFSKDLIDEIFSNDKSRFLYIDTKRKAVIYENKIITLDELKRDIVRRKRNI